MKDTYKNNFSSNNLTNCTTNILTLLIIILIVSMNPISSFAAAPCNTPNNVGGGMTGSSPGPVGAPNSLGWDVGGGQCNGSFSITSNPSFPGGSLELALRGEQRRDGAVALNGANDYTIQLGSDTEPTLETNRTWWNFQGSIGYGGNINNLDALTLEITTLVGPNMPVSPSFDMLAIRNLIDDRNNQPNPTAQFADLFQISQNPEFGWFTTATDTDANPTGRFDYDVPGAWRFTLTATENGVSNSVSICIHSPGENCVSSATSVPIFTPMGLIAMFSGLLWIGRRRKQ